MLHAALLDHCPNPEEIDQKLERLAQLTPVVTALAAHAESWLESLPFPAWVKNKHGRMVFINQFYSDRFRIDRRSYEGQLDDVAWGADTARVFGELDQKVNDTRKTHAGWEQLSDSHRVFVVKFPVYDGLEYVGPGGIVLYDEREAGIPRLAALHNQGPPGAGEAP